MTLIFVIFSTVITGDVGVAEAVQVITEAVTQAPRRGHEVMAEILEDVVTPVGPPSLAVNFKTLVSAVALLLWMGALGLAHVRDPGPERPQSSGASRDRDAKSPAQSPAPHEKGEPSQVSPATPAPRAPSLPQAGPSPDEPPNQKRLFTPRRRGAGTVRNAFGMEERRAHLSEPIGSPGPSGSRDTEPPPVTFLEKAEVFLQPTIDDPHALPMGIFVDETSLRRLVWSYQSRPSRWGESAIFSPTEIPGYLLGQQEQGWNIVYVMPYHTVVLEQLSEQDALGTFECESCIALAGYTEGSRDSRGFVSHVMLSGDERHSLSFSGLIQWLKAQPDTQAIRIVVVEPHHYPSTVRNQLLETLRVQHPEVAIEVYEFGQNAVDQDTIRKVRGGLILTTEGIGLYTRDAQARYQLVKFLRRIPPVISGGRDLKPGEDAEPPRESRRGLEQLGTFIDLKGVKRLLVPAAGFNLGVATDYLEQLPHVQEVFFEDVEYAQANEDGLRLGGWTWSNLAQAFQTLGVELTEAQLADLQQTGRLDVSSDYHGRPITWHLRGQNATVFPSGDVALADVTVVRTPGDNAILGSTEAFWRHVVARTRPGGLITVRRSPLPHATVARELERIYVPPKIAGMESLYIATEEVSLLDLKDPIERLWFEDSVQHLPDDDEVIYRKPASAAPTDSTAMDRKAWREFLQGVQRQRATSGKDRPGRRVERVHTILDAPVIDTSSTDSKPASAPTITITGERGNVESDARGTPLKGPGFTEIAGGHNVLQESNPDAAAVEKPQGPSVAQIRVLSRAEEDAYRNAGLEVPHFDVFLPRHRGTFAHPGGPEAGGAGPTGRDAEPPHYSPEEKIRLIDDAAERLAIQWESVESAWGECLRRDLFNAAAKAIADGATLASVQVQGSPGVTTRPLLSRMDSGAWSHVLSNLFVNAFHAMTESPERHLTIETGAEHGYDVVRITDTGHGIASENLERIWSRSFTKKPTGIRGTGRRLLIVKETVEGNGGTIQVESRRGGGTTFTIQFPIASPVDAPAPPAAPASDRTDVTPPADGHSGVFKSDAQADADNSGDNVSRIAPAHQQFWEDLQRHRPTPGARARVGRFLLQLELEQRGKLGRVILDLGSSDDPAASVFSDTGRHVILGIDIGIEPDIIDRRDLASPTLIVKADVQNLDKVLQRPDVTVLLSSQDVDSGHGPVLDTVICADILNYVDYQQVIHAVLRHLKPGGRLVIANMAALGHSVFSDKGVKSNAALLAFLQGLGLELEDVVNPPFDAVDSFLAAAYPEVRQMRQLIVARKLSGGHSTTAITTSDLAHPADEVPRAFKSDAQADRSPVRPAAQAPAIFKEFEAHYPRRAEALRIYESVGTFVAVRWFIQTSQAVVLTVFGIGLASYGFAGPWWVQLAVTVVGLGLLGGGFGLIVARRNERGVLPVGRRVRARTPPSESSQDILEDTDHAVSSYPNRTNPAFWRINNPRNFSIGSMVSSRPTASMMSFAYGGWMWIWIIVNWLGGYSVALVRSLSRVTSIRSSAVARAAFVASEDPRSTRTAWWPNVLRYATFVWSMAQRRGIPDSWRIARQSAVRHGHAQGSAQDNTPSRQSLLSKFLLRGVQEPRRPESAFLESKASHVEPSGQRSHTVQAADPSAISPSVVKSTIQSFQRQLTPALAMAAGTLILVGLFAVTIDVGPADAMSLLTAPRHGPEVMAEILGDVVAPIGTTRSAVNWKTMGSTVALLLGIGAVGLAHVRDPGPERPQSSSASGSSADESSPEPPAPSELFGAFIRRLRTDKKLTQQRLGEALGADNTIISMIETGRRQATAEQIRKLARELHFDPEPWISRLGKSRLAVTPRERPRPPTPAAAVPTPTHPLPTPEVPIGPVSTRHIQLPRIIPNDGSIDDRIATIDDRLRRGTTDLQAAANDIVDIFASVPETFSPVQNLQTAIDILRSAVYTAPVYQPKFLRVARTVQNCCTEEQWRYIPSLIRHAITEAEEFDAFRARLRAFAPVIGEQNGVVFQLVEWSDGINISTIPAKGSGTRYHIKLGMAVDRVRSLEDHVVTLLATGVDPKVEAALVDLILRSLALPLSNILKLTGRGEPASTQGAESAGDSTTAVIAGMSAFFAASLMGLPAWVGTLCLALGLVAMGWQFSKGTQDQWWESLARKRDGESTSVVSIIRRTWRSWSPETRMSAAYAQARTRRSSGSRTWRVTGWGVTKWASRVINARSSRRSSALIASGSPHRRNLSINLGHGVASSLQLAVNRIEQTIPTIFPRPLHQFLGKLQPFFGAQFLRDTLGRFKKILGHPISPPVDKSTIPGFRRQLTPALAVAAVALIAVQVITQAVSDAAEPAGAQEMVETSAALSRFWLSPLAFYLAAVILGPVAVLVDQATQRIFRERGIVKRKEATLSEVRELAWGWFLVPTVLAALAVFIPGIHPVVQLGLSLIGLGYSLLFAGAISNTLSFYVRGVVSDFILLFRTRSFEGFGTVGDLFIYGGVAIIVGGGATLFAGSVFLAVSSVSSRLLILTGAVVGLLVGLRATQTSPQDRRRVRGGLKEAGSSQRKESILEELESRERSEWIAARFI